MLFEELDESLAHHAGGAKNADAKFLVHARCGSNRPFTFSRAAAIRFTPSVRFARSAQKETRKKPSLSEPNALPGTVTTPASSIASATAIEEPSSLTSTIV